MVHNMFLAVIVELIYCLFIGNRLEGFQKHDVDVSVTFQLHRVVTKGNIYKYSDIGYTHNI